MTKLRKWFTKKIIGNNPVMMNVTICANGEIKGSKPDGVFEKCYIESKEKTQ